MSNSFYPVWKYHKDVEYLYVDFFEVAKDQDAIDLITATVEEGLKRPDDSLRILLNVKGKARTISPSALRAISVEGKKVQTKIKKSAIIGSVGLTTLLLKLYVSYTGSRLKFFTKKDIALDYLISN